MLASLDSTRKFRAHFVVDRRLRFGCLCSDVAKPNAFSLILTGPEEDVYHRQDKLKHRS